MNYKNQKGFTLIEVIVVAGIIAILAGILVPMIFNQIDESRKTKAIGDVKSMQSAVASFRKDTALWPNRLNGTDPTTNTIAVLYSTGTVVSGNGWVDANTGVARELYKFLSENFNGYTNWKGPYMSAVEADPWGNTYLIGAKNFEDATGTLPVWILSAGPDGIIQTPIDSAVCFDGKSIDPATTVATVGDDICMRFK